jgi:predicted nucleic-acid-binding Zn-ribbon protein
MGFLKDLLRPEVLRTCLKCGSTWTVPRYYTKRHSTESSIAPISGTGGLGGPKLIIPTGSAGDTMKPIPNDSTGSAQIRASYGVCPKCGSNAWTQKRQWSSSGKASEPSHNPNGDS